MDKIKLDYSITDQYGNYHRVQKEADVSYEAGETELAAYCDSFKNLLMDVGFTFLSDREIKFVAHPV